jgi:hypothetical protein
MPLSEERRSQLDSIVQQMEANGEPEDAIRFVVSDFKGKYEGATANDQDNDRGLAGTAGALAAAGVAVPAALRLGTRIAEQVATSPNVGTASRLLRNFGRPLNAVDAVIGVATGRKSIGSAARDAAIGEAVTRTPSILQRIALRLAPRLAATSGITTGGAMAGLALPIGVLATMQRDYENIEDHQTPLSRSIAAVLTPRK